MTTYDPPKRPTILMWTPFTTFARVNSTRYLDSGTHLDTQIKIKRVTPQSLIVDLTTSAATIHHTIHDLSLLAGEMYLVKMRYKNEGGWGDWSVPNQQAKQRVPSALSYTPIAVPTEPTSGGALPTNPSYTIDINRVHQFAEWETQTNHLGRRLLHEEERQELRMVWENLTAAEASALLVAIYARIAAAESFTLNDPNTGDHEWLIRAGSIEKSIQSKNPSGAYIWTVRADCDEVIGSQPFTVGVSQVAGPDEIS